MGNFTVSAFSGNLGPTSDPSDSTFLSATTPTTLFSSQIFFLDSLEAYEIVFYIIALPTKFTIRMFHVG